MCAHVPLCFKRKTPPSPMQTAFYALSLKSLEQSFPGAKTRLKCSHSSLARFWKFGTTYAFGVDHSGFLPFPAQRQFAHGIIVELPFTDNFFILTSLTNAIIVNVTFLNLWILQDKFRNQRSSRKQGTGKGFTRSWFNK